MLLPRLRFWLTVSCAVLSSTSGGCSVLFVTEVPDRPERLAYFDCTSSRLAPVLDTAIGGVLVIAAGSIMLDSAQRDVSGATAGTATSLAVAGAAVASAVYGFSKTNRCATAKDELAERTLQRKPTLSEMPGCNADLECRGERICVDRQCVDPPATTGRRWSPAEPGAVPPSAAPAASTVETPPPAPAASAVETPPRAPAASAAELPPPPAAPTASPAQ